MSSETLARVINVEKKYGKTRVLGPISLEIHPGEFIGLRGPNGAGKTTLLSIIANVLKPDSGTFEQSKAAKTGTSYLPQELSLYETLTCEQNLRYWGLIHSLPPSAIASRTRFLLERQGFFDKLKCPVSALSGGMKRRLHLATALMITPKLLLLDEPTVGADPDSVNLILEMLTHFNKRNTAIIMIDHNFDELSAVCDKILTLEAGQITEEVRP